MKKRNIQKKKKTPPAYLSNIKIRTVFFLLLSVVVLMLILFMMPVRTELNGFSVSHPRNWIVENSENTKSISSPDEDLYFTSDDWVTLLKDPESGSTPVNAMWITVLNERGRVEDIVKSPECIDTSYKKVKFESGYYECSPREYGIAVVLDVSQMAVDGEIFPGGRKLVPGGHCHPPTQADTFVETCEDVVRTIEYRLK